MTTQEEIERIVREVMRRLNSPGRQLGTARTLHIADHVVTLSTIEGRMTDVRELIVNAKAIVTPSVQDELKDKDIRLVRHALNEPQSTQKLLIANLGTEDMSVAMGELSCEVQMVQQSSLEGVISNMAKQLVDSLGLIITDQPERAVCLANRYSNVRAFVGTGDENVRRAKAMNANLMALDSLLGSTNLAKAFIA